MGVAIEGEPGIGKSTLWIAAVNAARDRGFHVFEATPAEPDSAIAAAGLRDLFAGVPESSLRELAPPQRRAIVAALSAQPDSDSVQIAPLSQAVLSLLRSRAAAAPVLVAIDDEQWLDPLSARALGFALIRVRNERIGALLARRPGQDGALWREVARRFAAEGMPRMVLHPLEFEVICAILTDRVGVKFSRALLRRIYRTCAGNALYAVAIAEELASTQAVNRRIDELPIPSSLADALESKLASAGGQADEAMLAVASLSHPTLALIHGVLPEFRLSDLEAAERAGVIEITRDGVRFSHPLLASTHYAAAPASRRRALHRRIAEVLGDEVERAHHLALGAEAPDAGLALTLEQAAQTAARRGAVEIAAQLLEDAVRFTPVAAGQMRHSRIVAAAEQRFNCGELARVRGLLEPLIAELPGEPLRARALLTLSLARSADDGLQDDVVEMLEQAEQDAGTDDRLRVRLELELASTMGCRREISAGLVHARRAVQAAERIAEPGFLGLALAQLAEAAHLAGEPADPGWIERAVALEPHVEVSTYYLPSVYAGRLLAWTYELNAARILFERGLERALARGEEWDHLGLVLALALLECDAGNLDAAERYKESAERERGECGIDTDGWIAMIDVSLALARGSHASAIRTADQALVDARRAGLISNVNHLTKLLAIAELWDGQPERAHVHLKAARSRMIDSGYGSLINGPTAALWSFDVESLILLGRLDEAELLLADLEERARRVQNPHIAALASRNRGFLAAAHGDYDGALDQMNAGLVEHRRRPIPFELGRTLVEKGSLERRLARKSAARETLRQAVAILEPIQATFWLQRAHEELARIGQRRPRSTDGLTPVQHSIAELVATGMSNPEIGRTLHMSASTVEKHLTKAYRALGVRGRSQLAAALASSASVSS